MKKILLVFPMLFIFFALNAMSWDEPWREEIIKKADYFLSSRVIFASDSLVSVKVIDNFGPEVQDTINIKGFFLLDICSRSESDGTHFNLSLEDRGYFFLKKKGNEIYSLPTPTSGFDMIYSDAVICTYRHSLHKSALSVELYEKTYKAIWNSYKKHPYDNSQIIEYINKTLKLSPATDKESDLIKFFEQYAALETAYHLKIRLPFDLLQKYVYSVNIHHQISAIRAISIINNEVSNTFLIDYIKKKKNSNFNKVIAIWSIWKIEDKYWLGELRRIAKNVSDEREGFTMNLMDPRICTHLPSPRQAIFNLNKK